MSELSLRPATAADAEAVAAIWWEGWRIGHLGHVPEALVAVRTPESFRARAAARVADTVIAVADGTNQPSGTARDWSRPADGTDSPADQQRGAADQTSGAADQPSGAADQTSGAADRAGGNGPEIAGFVMVVRDEVEQVYVSAAHRGSGAASVLLAEAERLVAAGGYGRAWLAVVAGNTRARRFYERSGWVDDGLFDYAAAVPGGVLAVPAHRYLKRIVAPSA